MPGKWDQQAQAGAPDELRWMKMAGSAQIGQTNDGTFFWLFPSVFCSPRDGIIVLKAPQGPSHVHRYRSLWALYAAVFVAFYKAVAYRKILLES